MWPILFSIGSFKVTTSSLMLILGFIVTGFVFWRRGKEEHYSEIQLFDGFLLSFLVGFLGARASFILLHWDRFGLNVGQWLNFTGNPGAQGIVFIIIATFFLASFSKKKKWDTFEILDFWSLSMTIWLVMNSLSEFLAGSATGRLTSGPIGIVFPGSIEKTHPVQIYSLIFFLSLYLYLAWAEGKYRTFEWYRLGKKAAQTGFMISNFFIFFSLFSAIMLFFRLPEFVVAGRSFDLWIYILIFFFGVRMLLARSDKPLLPVSMREKLFKKKKQEE
jgi:prolipoprotein diacylglyceryltransferase